MRIIRSIKQMQKASRELAAKGKRIGLVPTMGFLHEGHLSLIKRALKIAKIEAAGGEIVFIPKANEIYPDDFQTYVEVEELTQELEGKKRPTHFRGVTTIVAKLFNITRPDVAVFGMKDFQQAAVLKQMTADLGYPIKFVIAPTVREKSGLAMSSRNKYFTDEQKTEALGLYYSLKSAKAMIKSGVRDARKVEREMRAVIKSHCRTAKIDYIAFTDINTLLPHSRVSKSTVCSLAVHIHGVRLIDNMKLA